MAKFTQYIQLHSVTVKFNYIHHTRVFHSSNSCNGQEQVLCALQLYEKVLQEGSGLVRKAEQTKEMVSLTK